MNTYDTINLSVPFSLINTYEAGRYRTRETKTGIMLQECHDTKQCGLNFIRRNEAKGEFVISLTAKILGREYPQLLSALTMPRALEIVRKTGLIGDFSPEDVINGAHIMLCHVTQDLHLKHEVREYLTVLKRLHVNTKYTVTDYANKNSVTFVKNNRTARAREYGKLYGKSYELELSSNKNYRDSLAEGDLLHVRQQFRDKVRFELELTSVSKLRQYFKLPIGKGSPPVKLFTLLHSHAKPLQALLKKLLAHIVMSPEDADEKAFFASLSVKEKCLMGYCRLFRYDLAAIEYHLKQDYPKRPQTARGQFKAAKILVSRYRAQEANMCQQQFDLLTELKQAVGCAF